jgi:hypothetical protein
MDELDMNEQNIIRVLNRADSIIRNANILESEYLNKFNDINNYIQQPDLAINRIDEFLNQVKRGLHIKAERLKVASPLEVKSKEGKIYWDDTDNDILDETIVLDKTPEKSFRSLNSTLQLEQSYFEDIGLPDSNSNTTSGSPTIDIIASCDLLKFTQPAFDTDNNIINRSSDDDNEATVVLNNNNCMTSYVDDTHKETAVILNDDDDDNNTTYVSREEEQSHHHHYHTATNVTDAEENGASITIPLKNDFEIINLTNSFQNKISFGSINLPGKNNSNNNDNQSDNNYDDNDDDNDIDTSSLSQLYSEHIAEMSAKKSGRESQSNNNFNARNHSTVNNDQNNYDSNNPDDDWLDDDEMSSSLNKLYNVSNPNSNRNNSNYFNNQQSMSIKVSIMKNRRKTQQQCLNVKQLGSATSAISSINFNNNRNDIDSTSSSSSKYRKAREMDDQKDVNTSSTTLGITNLVESSSLNKHQYAAIIWMLLREKRLKIAKRLSGMVFGKSYFKNLVSNDSHDGVKKQEYDFISENDEVGKCFDSNNNNILSFLHGGILADEPGLKKAATVASLISITTGTTTTSRAYKNNNAKHASIIITSPARIESWRQVLSCVPFLKVHYYTKKKAARTHSVSILMDPTNYFNKYDVIVTTFSIITCNEVDSKTAVRKSAWINRKQEPLPVSSPSKDSKNKKKRSKVTFLHLTFFERVILDQAHTFATTTSKKYLAIRNLKCNYRWCLCDNVPATSRRLSTLLTFLTKGYDTKLSIQQIAAITAAKDVCEGSKIAKPSVIMLARTS